MTRWLSNSALCVSLLLFATVCVFWVGSRSGTDEVSWTYDRYLSDRSAAANQVYLTSDQRIWLSVNWGHVRPFDGQLVWGYYVNADESGGRPRLNFRSWRRQSEDPLMNWVMANGGPKEEGTGFGPFWWQSSSRSAAIHGNDFRMIRIGISHWMLALFMLLPPMFWLRRHREALRSGLYRMVSPAVERPLPAAAGL